MAVLPARVRRPRDKAKAEVAVQVVERWILAALRHRTFLSLAELNAAIAKLLERLNTRPFRKLPGSRRSCFEQLDRPALRPLPASHVRSSHQGRHTTAPEHMPEQHRQMGEWTPECRIRRAEKVGPQTAALVTAVLNAGRHPQQACRSCLGLLRLARCYGDARMEAAAARALAIGSYSYRSVESILQHRLDATAAKPFERADPVRHDNIRGALYYQ